MVRQWQVQEELEQEREEKAQRKQVRETRA